MPQPAFVIAGLPEQPADRQLTRLSNEKMAGGWRQIPLMYPALIFLRNVNIDQRFQYGRHNDNTNPVGIILKGPPVYIVPTPSIPAIFSGYHPARALEVYRPVDLIAAEIPSVSPVCAATKHISLKLMLRGQDCPGNGPSSLRALAADHNFRCEPRGTNHHGVRWSSQPKRAFLVASAKLQGQTRCCADRVLAACPERR